MIIRNQVLVWYDNGGVLWWERSIFWEIKDGRNKLRSIMDTVENIDATTIEEIQICLKISIRQAKKGVQISM